MLAAHFSLGKGLDLNATFRGNRPPAVPPLPDSGTGDAEGVGETTDPAIGADRDQNAGIDICTHDMDDKAILDTTQALLTAEEDPETSSEMPSSKTSDDSTRLAERLRAAFAACGSRAPDVKNAISRELGISRQAIDGWLRTGRIGKTRLVIVARHTGQSLDYFLGSADMTAQEQDEVELVLQFRTLPEALKQKLVADAKAYAELAKPVKPAKSTKK